MKNTYKQNSLYVYLKWKQKLNHFIDQFYFAGLLVKRCIVHVKCGCKSNVKCLVTHN